MALGVHRGRVHVHAPATPGYEFRWQGERDLRLPHGVLAFVATTGEGLAADRVASCTVTIAPRRGGERLTLDARRPRRALAAWLYDAALPPWERDALPLVFCDGVLAAVPSLGADLAWRAAPGRQGWRLDWRPDVPLARRDGARAP
jgi:tRNA(Ile)-lysidine synthase